MSALGTAALLGGAILLATMLSVEIGLSVALLELLAGAVIGGAFHVAVPAWLDFVGSFAGIVLIFQAGAEVDVAQFTREWRASLSIGLASFLLPFVVVTLVAVELLGWHRRPAELAGLALSDTSLAVVYALLVETGLNRDLLGKRLMSATFVTDIAAVTGLTALFLQPTLWIIPFVGVSVVLVVALPRLSPWFFGRYGRRVIEPEIKLAFAALFLLMWLGARAESQAALPAFVLGLAMSGHYAKHRHEQERMRVVGFAFLTPFFFLKGGMNVSAHALGANLGVLAALFAAKVVPKALGVYPLARRYMPSEAIFTTLLMSTGLSFGTIIALFGLNDHVIDRTQFSLLIGVIVLTAVIPTAIAQRFFHPQLEHHPHGPLPEG